MFRKRLLGALTAFAVMTSVIPTTAFADPGASVPAPSARPPRTGWSGHALKDEPVSVWDGTSYDTSWLSDHAGTESDPYIIADAADLAGLSTLTMNPGYSVAQTMFYTDASEDSVLWEPLANVPFGNSISYLMIYDKTKSLNDVSAYYRYSGTYNPGVAMTFKGLTPEGMKATGEVIEREGYGGSIDKYAAMIPTALYAKVQVGATTKQVDIFPALKAYYDSLSEEEINAQTNSNFQFYYSVVNGTARYNSAVPKWDESAMTWAQYCQSVETKLADTSSYEYDVLKEVFADYAYGITITKPFLASLPVRFMPRVYVGKQPILGEIPLSEFGVSPVNPLSISEYNGYNTIDINESNVDNFIARTNLGNNSSAYYSYTPSMESLNVATPVITSGDPNWNWSDDYSRPYVEDSATGLDVDYDSALADPTSVSLSDITTITMSDSFYSVNSMVYKESGASSDYMEDRDKYYVSDTFSNHKTFKVYTVDVSLVVAGGTLCFLPVIRNIETGEEITQTPVGGSFFRTAGARGDNLKIVGLSGMSMDFNYSTKVAKLKITKFLATSDSNPDPVEYSLGDAASVSFTFESPDKWNWDVVPLYKLSDGQKTDWDRTNLEYVGTTTTSISDFRQYLAVNDLSDAIAATIVGSADVTFAGKHFKLAGNIDLGDNADKWIGAFPMSADDSTGFAGSFDGDNHFIIYRGAPVFGQILPSGSVENVVFVQGESTNAALLGFAAIKINKGEVSDVTCLNEHVFYNTDSADSTTNVGAALISSSYGKTHDITIYNGVRHPMCIINSSNGDVHDVDFIFTDNILTEKAADSDYVTHSLFGSINSGKVYNIHVDAASDTINANKFVVLRWNGLTLSRSYNENTFFNTCGSSPTGNAVATVENLYFYDFDLYANYSVYIGGTRDLIISDVYGEMNLRSANDGGTSINNEHEIGQAYTFSNVNLYKGSISGGSKSAIEIENGNSFIGAYFIDKCCFLIKNKYTTTLRNNTSTLNAIAASKVTDSDISITCDYENYADYCSKVKYGASNSATVNIVNAYDSKITVDTVGHRPFGYAGKLIFGKYYNCDISVSDVTNLPQGGGSHPTYGINDFAVFDSKVKIKNLSNMGMYGGSTTDNYRYVSLGLNTAKNSEIEVEFTGDAIPANLVENSSWSFGHNGEIVENCVIKAHYKGYINATNRNPNERDPNGDVMVSTGTASALPIKDTTFIYTFDEGCYGSFQTMTSASTNVDNCLIYIDEMPNGLNLYNSIVGLADTSYDAKYSVKGLTVIAPKVNILNPAYSIFGNGISGYGWNCGYKYKEFSDTYIYANLYAKNNDALKKLICLPLVESAATDVIAEVNVFDPDGVTPRDTEVYGYANTYSNFISYTVPFVAINQTVLKSNTKSNKSSLVGLHAYDIDGIVNGSKSLILANCYLCLPNTIMAKDLTPSADAVGYTPGLVSVINGSSEIWNNGNFKGGIWLSEPDEHPADSYAKYHGEEFAAYLTNECIAIGNCYVYDGKSALSQVFKAGDTLDSWNAPLYATSKDETPTLLTTPRGEEGFECTQVQDENGNIVLPSSVSYMDDERETKGELAYLLDNGGNYIRRTYNFTVYEDIDLVDPTTGTKLYTIPTHTGLCREYYPDKAIGAVDGVTGAELNRNPVFKYTMNPADDGKITIVGIADNTTFDGSIYAKQKSNLVAKAEAFADDVILVYATHKLNDAPHVKIDNMKGYTVESVEVESDHGFDYYSDGSAPTPSANGARSSAVDEYYSIEGYRAQGADTEITPVFKTARHITVEIKDPDTGDISTKGTVIPSTYVSAENEIVKFTYNTEDGYIISNLKVVDTATGGDNFSYTPTDYNFMMPDADVTITGYCVPFTCGIKEFSLFGVKGDINQITHTITLTVPRSGGITNALPSIEYVGNHIIPSTSSRIDFSNADTVPVPYTVYPEDDNNHGVEYLVTVYQTEYSMRIYDFVLEGVHGDINHAKRTIEVLLPANTDLSNLTPDDIAYSAEYITPDVDTACDFRAGVPYTLHADTEGLDPVTYMVYAKAADGTVARITSYKVSGYNGSIREVETGNSASNPSTITLNVPEGSDLSSIRPDLITYIGKTLSPSKLDDVDIADTAQYIVTNQLDAPRFYSVNARYFGEDTAKITRFVLDGEEGTIDEDNKKIYVSAYDKSLLYDIAPDVVEYEAACIYPTETDLVDFTSGKATYKAIATNGREVDYEVIIQNSAAILIRFDVMGIVGDIDQVAKTVTLRFPYGYDPSNTAPSEVAVSKGATISPLASDKNNFTVEQLYTVTSEDGKHHNTYRIIPIFEPAYDNRITKFTLDGVDGEIQDVDGTPGGDIGTIKVVIHEHDDMPDLSDIVPDVLKISEGATITPAKDTPKDFTVPATYVVHGRNRGDRTYTVLVTVIPRDKTAIITEFEINDHPGVIEQPDPDIPDDKGIITVYIPITDPTPIDDVQPEITWEGETINPDDHGDPQDFSDPDNPVEYTVTAEDPSVTNTYIVIIKYIECIISEFEINNVPGVIDQDAKTIDVTLPYNTNLVNVIPSKITWIGDNLNPAEDSPQNFKTPVVYTVMADAEKPEERVWKNYLVTVKLEPAPDIPVNPPVKPPVNPPSGKDPKIIEFWLKGESGDIDQDKGTITIHLPEGTDVKNVPPDRIVWTGDTIDPTPREKQDFTTPTTYKVTAGDKTKTYVVTVIFDKDGDKPGDDPGDNPGDTPGDTPGDNPGDVPGDDLGTDCRIISYTLEGVNGTINQETGRITIVLPYTYTGDLDNLIPDEIIWIGDELIPSADEAQDFNMPVPYRVYAEDHHFFKDYMVYVSIADEPTDDNPNTGDPYGANQQQLMALLTCAAFVMSAALAGKKKKEENEDV